MTRIRDDFSIVQPQAVTNLQREGEKLPVQPQPAILEQIKKFDPGILATLVGDAGSKLQAFANVVDAEHPELSQCLPTTACKAISEWLQLCEFTYNNNLSVVLTHVRALSTRELNSLKNVDDPAKTQRLVRLVRDKETRNKIRSAKSVRKVDLSAFYRSNLWDNLPESLSMYVRFGEGQKSEIEKAERRLARYKALGVKSLTEQIEASLIAFKGKTQDEFIGFRKLAITDAACLLAKMHSYTYTFGPSGYDYAGKITAPRDIFGFNFDEIKDRSSLYEYVPASRPTKSLPVSYDFTPRAYNFSELATFASKETLQIVDRLESMPEVGGKPLFDHFVVVVPSIDFPVAASLRYEYMTPNGDKRSFRDAATAHRNFDIELIRNKSITPIILGERDDKCYFISYFE